MGKGSYGVVQLVKLKKTGLMRAVKIIKKQRVKNVERLRREVRVMMGLDHPSIIKLYDYFEDASNVYLILELCSGGELFDRILKHKYYSEDNAKIIFSQIAKAIKYCHLRGVVHRDLKPENFIMISQKDPFRLKLIDFGLSKTFKVDKPQVLQEKETNAGQRSGRRQLKCQAVLRTKTGTPFYIAPEVLSGVYNEKCDV